jgi:hypothetical protein
MNKNTLWQFRNEIVLNSLLMSDYHNSFGFTSESVCDFFDGYMEYLEQLATEQYGSGCSIEQIFSFDTPDNLYNWYGCFELCPFKREV